MIGAHKWISQWQPAVEKYRFQLIPVTENPIDRIWTGNDRVRNQDPLEILDIGFTGTLSKYILYLDISNYYSVRTIFV